MVNKQIYLERVNKMMKLKKDQKGFSLVEMVIVIAIMAVIISILAPQFLRYIETSRRGEDADLVGVIHRVLSAAMADTDIDDRPVGGYGGAGASKHLSDLEDGTMPDFAEEVALSLGASDLTTFEANAFESNAYKGAMIQVEVDPTRQHVTVTVLSNLPDVDDLIVH